MVQLVVPDQLKEEISKQMRQEYQIDFHTKLSENALYRMVCRKYLRHVQKSVFEGNLTEAKLKRLKNELKKISNEKEDSIIIYRFETLKYSSKEVLGTYEEDSNFL